MEVIKKIAIIAVLVASVIYIASTISNFTKVEMDIVELNIRGETVEIDLRLDCDRVKMKAIKYKNDILDGKLGFCGEEMLNQNPLACLDIYSERKQEIAAWSTYYEAFCKD